MANLAPDSELETFKTSINLTEFAAAAGYELDRRASSRNSVVMRHSNGDKLIVARDRDQHWVYFSVKDSADHGSIVDFVQRRRGLNLGQVRKELRNWIGGPGFPPPYRPPATAFVPDLQPLQRDLAAVRARWEAAEPIARHHAYLEHQRGIPAAVLAAERFSGRIRCDSRGNALFPHWSREGLCGFEIKNEGFTGFAPGGIKGLWGSRTREDDNRLVIAETAIDALSYAVLKGFERTRLVSIAGQMNDDQPALLLDAVRKMPPGSLIIGAFDQDDGGDLLLEQVRGHLRQWDVVDDRPETRGHDWNNVLIPAS